MEFPEELRYTDEHEWARVEGARVRVGITDFAQDALGDVVYVDLPDIGATVEAAQPFGEVESTKSVSDVFSPVAEQPYGEGWLVVLEPDDPAAVEGLLDAQAYRAFVDETS